jgi:hypothetical protein
MDRPRVRLRLHFPLRAPVGGADPRAVAAEDGLLQPADLDGQARHRPVGPRVTRSAVARASDARHERRAGCGRLHPGGPAGRLRWRADVHTVRGDLPGPGLAPDPVRSLGALPPGRRLPVRLAPEAFEAIAAVATAGWGEADVLTVVAPSVANDPRMREWWGRWERLSCSPGTMAAIVRVAFETDVRPVLESVRAPTLVLHRTGDQFARSNMAATWPGTSLVRAWWSCPASTTRTSSATARPWSTRCRSSSRAHVARPGMPQRLRVGPASTDRCRRRTLPDRRPGPLPAWAAGAGQLQRPQLSAPPPVPAGR